MLRSILSILAGIITWGALSAAVSFSLMAAMPGQFDEDGTTDNSGILLTYLVMSIFYALAAGFVTAALAKRKIMRHVAVLAIVELAIGILVQVTYWDAMPLWYHLPFLALVVPCHLLGGKLWLARTEMRPVTA